MGQRRRESPPIQKNWTFARLGVWYLDSRVRPVGSKRLLASLTLVALACVTCTDRFTSDSSAAEPVRSEAEGDSEEEDAEADAAAGEPPSPDDAIDSGAPDSGLGTQQPAQTDAGETPLDASVTTASADASADPDGGSVNLDAAGPSTAPDAATETPAGACENPDDIASLEAVDDAFGEAQSCAIGCALAPAGCHDNCIADNLGVSESCGDCFVDLISCMAANCVLQCIDPGSSVCQRCERDRCRPPLVECAGVSPP